MIYEYNAIVKSVYDGDSITVDIDLGFGIWMKKQKIRLWGINAAEIRGDSRVQGLIIRDQLRSWIPEGSEIVIRTIKDKKGKYGRWLGIILKNDKIDGTININSELLKLDGVVKYE